MTVGHQMHSALILHSSCGPGVVGKVLAATRPSDGLAAGLSTRTSVPPCPCAAPVSSLPAAGWGPAPRPPLPDAGSMLGWLGFYPGIL